MDIFGSINRFAGDVFGKAGGLTENLTDFVSGGQPDISEPAIYGPGGAADGSGVGQVEQIHSSIDPRFDATKDTVSLAEGTFDQEAGRPDYTMRFGDAPGEGSLDTSAPHPGDPRPSRYGSGYVSAASGAYQFMPDTWERINDGNAPMTPQNQDDGFRTLIDERGFDVEANFRDEAHKIAPEWASIPMQNGRSRYDQPVKDVNYLDDFHQERVQHHEDRRRQDVYRQRAFN